MTTMTFVQKATIKHGSKYEYNSVVYTGSHQKVKIACPAHGPFWQMATNHLSGQGCPKCHRNKPISTGLFVKKAISVHGLLYVYSNVQYAGSYQKVEIMCRVHGPFWQSPTSHLAGNGCPKCAGNSRYNTGQFIMRARLIHGNRYQYNEADYKSNGDKVVIYCPKHGVFRQMPVAHLRGSGCPRCAKPDKAERAANFRASAELLHELKYQYNDTAYVNGHTKVPITCPVHSEFWQKPSMHLVGQGCPKCAKNALPGFYRAGTFRRHPELKNKPGLFYCIRFTNTSCTFFKVGIAQNESRSFWVNRPTRQKSLP